MSTEAPALPIIDLERYYSPKSPEDKEHVIAEVREACTKYGFFQIKNHGIPMKTQEAYIEALGNLFNLPTEEKRALSFLKNPCRRGYEGSGDSHREGDKMADSKEAFYIGQEDKVVEPPGFHGPNLWPNLPEDKFRGPVWEHYQETVRLGQTIWEILLQGLGFPASLLEAFAKRPIVIMKMIRYPPAHKTLEGQFGVGAHNDFGGVTVLLQQANREGLEVYDDKRQVWFPVPAIKDVYVINMGDMIQKWSGGVYQSARHRVVRQCTEERFSSATFWHGDFSATNPLNPNDPHKETVGQLLIKRFGNQFSLSEKVKEYTKNPSVSVGA